MELNGNHRRHVALIFDTRIRIAQVIEQLRARIFKVKDIVRMVDDAHHVCFRITDGKRHR